jgi:predicted transcriptional regulator
MPRKQLTNKMSVYIPETKREHQLVERLVRIAERRDRSVNYLVVEAILQYLEREEKA